MFMTSMSDEGDVFIGRNNPTRAWLLAIVDELARTVRADPISPDDILRPMWRSTDSLPSHRHDRLRRITRLETVTTDYANGVGPLDEVQQSWRNLRPVDRQRAMEIA